MSEGVALLCVSISAVFVQVEDEVDDVVKSEFEKLQQKLGEKPDPA